MFRRLVFTHSSVSSIVIRLLSKDITACPVKLTTIGKIAVRSGLLYIVGHRSKAGPKTMKWRYSAFYMQISCLNQPEEKAHLDGKGRRDKREEKLCGAKKSQLAQIPFSLLTRSSLPSSWVLLGLSSCEFFARMCDWQCRFFIFLSLVFYIFTPCRLRVSILSSFHRTRNLVSSLVGLSLSCGTWILVRFTLRHMQKFVFRAISLLLYVWAHRSARLHLDYVCQGPLVKLRMLRIIFTPVPWQQM